MSYSEKIRIDNMSDEQIVKTDRFNRLFKKHKKRNLDNGWDIRSARDKAMCDAMEEFKTDPLDLNSIFE